VTQRLFGRAATTREIRAQTKSQPSVEEMKRRSATALEQYKESFMTEKQREQLKAQQEWFAQKAAREAMQKSSKTAPQKPSAASMPPQATPPQTTNVALPLTASSGSGELPNLYPHYKQQDSNPSPAQPPAASDFEPGLDPGQDLVEVRMPDGQLQVMSRNQAVQLANQTGSTLVAGGDNFLPYDVAPTRGSAHPLQEPRPGSALPMTHPRPGSALPMTPSLYSSHDPYNLPQYQSQVQSMYASQDPYAGYTQPQQQSIYSSYDPNSLPQYLPPAQQQTSLYSSRDPNSLPQYPQPASQQPSLYSSRDPYSFSDMAASLPEYQPMQPPPPQQQQQQQQYQQPVAQADWEAQGAYQFPPLAGHTPPPQQPTYQAPMPLQQQGYAPPQGMQPYPNMQQPPRAGSALPAVPSLYNSHAQAPMSSQGPMAGSALAMQQPRANSALPMSQSAYDPYSQPGYQQQFQQYPPQQYQQPQYQPQQPPQQPPPQYAPQYAPTYVQQPAYGPPQGMMMPMQPRVGSAVPMAYAQPQMWAEM